MTDSQSKTAIIVALISLAGALGAAVIGNWDKLFAPKQPEPSRETVAEEPGPVRTPSGLIYRSLKPGSGARPIATDTVQVHFQGSLIDGTVFDRGIGRHGRLPEFALNGVIPCLTEGLQMMRVGEKAKLICPPSIAFGDKGMPPAIPGGATVVFEVELLSIKK